MDAPDRLESWKEIAAYFGREVRTVQLWEKSEGLPIHRLQHGRQGTVHAFKSELDAWRAARTAAPVERPTRIGTMAKVVWSAAAVAVLAALGFGARWWIQRSHPAPSAIVVLPFLDFSPAHDQQSFADSLTEEIITALSRVPALKVVARTSAFAFKGRGMDIRDIGRALGVDVVLEGSVGKSGDQLRVTAQLNRASDGTHLWSRVYDRPLRDVFAVQDEIAQAIAGELRAGTVPRRPPPTDVEAWQLYQEGRYFFTQFQAPTSNYKAIERYNLAIARDPNFALAYAGLSGVYAYLAENFSVAPRDVMPKAKEAAQKAVALDPESAEAHASLGAIILDYDWDVDAAQRELKTAMELNPGAAWAKHCNAHSLEAQGRVADALTEMRAALALDPLSIPINWDVGSELISLNRLDDADAHLRKAAELFPASPIIGFLRAEAAYRLGRPVEAHVIIDGMLQSQPGAMQVPYFQALVGAAAVHEGRRDDGLRALARLEALPATVYVEAFPVIELCSALKDHACVARWMQRLVDDRSTLRPYIRLLTRAYLDDPDAAAIAEKLP